MQQYTTTFCRRPPTILDTPTTTPTRTNRHNRCSNHKAFFCSLLRRWFWEKKPVHKDRKTMCLKAWQRKLQEEKPRLSYLLRGTKNRQKTFSICWLDECCHLVVKFSSLQLKPFVCGWKTGFFCNDERTDDELPQQKSRQIMMSADSLMSISPRSNWSRKGNWKVVKIHTTQFPEKP